MGPAAMRNVPQVLVASLLAVPMLAGCLGGTERTEWAYDDAGLDALRATGRTGKGITIALLDTGLDPNHVALDHLIDDDPNNGRLVAFKDFLGNAEGIREAFDDQGHGTHIAGILAARGSSGRDKLLYNGVELRGAAPDANYVIGRVCATTCDARLLATAVTWAADEGADVISLSLGGQFNLTDLQVALQIQQALDAAIDRGVVIVAAAGNQGPDNVDVESPANLPGVLAVGAIGKDGLVADFSSRGSASANDCRLDPGTLPVPLPPGLPQLPLLPQVPSVFGRCDPDKKPEIVAPGVAIQSTWSGIQDDDPCQGAPYCVASGTSQATPFVTAAVALMLEGRSGLTSRADVEAVKQALVDAATPVPGQILPHDVAAGYGALDAVAALRLYEEAQ